MNSNKEELEKLFLEQNHTVSEIAIILGIAKSTAQRWLKSYNISKPPHLAAIARGTHHQMNRPQVDAGTYSLVRPTTERLRELYCGRNMRRSDIATEFDVPVWVIKKWLSEDGIIKPQSLACINSQQTRIATNSDVNERIGFGVAGAWADHREEILARRTATSLQRYGVANPASSSVVQDKRRKTNEAKYGVSNPMFDSNIVSQNKSARFKKKTFVFPSGKTVITAGYEGFYLRDLLAEGYCEEDLLCANQGLPIIPYMLDGKTHHHLPDVLVRSDKLLVDVKSEFTLAQQTGYTEKAQAAAIFGFSYAVVIYDQTGKLLCRQDY